MKIKRIISSLLAVLMLASAFAFTASADETTESSAPAGQETSNTVPTLDYFTGKMTKLDEQSGAGDKKSDKWVADGEKIIYTEEDKLNTMTKMLQKDGYILYVDKFSGEVAVYCEATGEALFSNPYNIADSTAVDSVKSNLMSQLVVNYTDIATGQTNEFYSYKEAVRDGDNIKGQINVRNIKNGVRVEYTIGREEARLLVPQMIKKERFEEQISSVMLAAIETYKVEGGTREENKHYEEANHQYKRLMAFYLLQDPDAVTGTVKETMQKKYPITKKMAVYTLDESTTAAEKTRLESFIKTYCPDYSYEDLDEDHMITEYVAEDKNPPLFKMALEYSLDSTGMTVRLPANGIRFNEALYQLNSIDILPFMGAGAYSNKEASAFVNNEGYTFFPDGSGSIFDFAKITDMGQETSIKGKVYGQDYAYHTITGTHQEVIRYPVFGIVRGEDENLIKYNKELAEKQAELNANAGEGEKPNAEDYIEKPETKDINSSGFVAIVEEGDALMELTTYHYVVPSEYNTIKMSVYPRPQDTYSIADAISVGSAGAEWTVVSSRKYTGNYKIKYIMLSDEAGSKYDCSYAGMANAYRDYLVSKEILTKLTDEDVREDIPLYIETFGAIETTERILSIPVEVMTPLTTFDDVKTMYDELSAKGIDNINFIMTGYTKGGMTSTQVPYNLKWEKNVSDELDFEDLLAYAKEKNFGLYPDFDFAYTQSNGMFDGLSLSKHSVKTIDDRYTTRREYSATKQTYVSYFDIAISPAYYSHFYEKLAANYMEYAPTGISVSTLGSALNSDFDEDEPYNREDSKSFTVKAMEYFDSLNIKVMTSGGNAYTWKYVDYITDVALDSSRFSQAYASVPFLGMVLHGYVEIAGTPLNMEGNIDYAILKAIENGASLNFILSFRNTNNLKNFEDLSKYYSVRYDIWFDDVVDIYNEVNSVLAGVQTSTIDKHMFIEGIRVPDADELLNDAQATIEAAIAKKEEYNAAVKDYEINSVRNARERLEAIADEFEYVKQNLNGTFAGEANADFDGLVKAITKLDVIVNNIANGSTTGEETIKSFKQIFEAFKDAETELAVNPNDEDTKTKYNTAKEALLAAYTNVTYISGYMSNAADALNGVVRLIELSKLADDYMAIIEQSNMSTDYQNTYKSLVDAIRNDMLDIVNEIYKACDSTEQLAIADAANYEALIETLLENTVKGFIDSVSGYSFTSLTDEEKATLVPNMDDYKFVIWTPNPENENDTKPEGQGIVITKVTKADLTANDPKMPEPLEEEKVPTYASDTNKIVYEVYSNGTAFLLNFNNYTVKVGLDVDGDGNDDAFYTIGAYDYVVVASAS